MWLLVLIAFNSVIWLLYLALIVFCFYCLGLMLFGLFGLLLSAELLIVLVLYFFGFRFMILVSGWYAWVDVAGCLGASCWLWLFG